MSMFDNPVTPAENHLFNHSAFDESLFVLLWGVIISSINKAGVRGHFRHDAAYG